MFISSSWFLGNPVTSPMISSMSFGTMRHTKPYFILPLPYICDSTTVYSSSKIFTKQDENVKCKGCHWGAIGLTHFKCIKFDMKTRCFVFIFQSKSKYIRIFPLNIVLYVYLSFIYLLTGLCLKILILSNINKLSYLLLFIICSIFTVIALITNSKIYFELPL